jgi:hypothetical protein
MSAHKSGEFKKLIISRIDDLIDLWLQGVPLKKAAEQLFLPPSTHIAVYQMPETRELMRAARETKAALLVDDALEWAGEAGASGTSMLDSSLMSLGVNTNLKVASKLDPKTWGDKTQMELSGGVQVEQNLSITPAEAYERMLKGGD